MGDLPYGISFILDLADSTPVLSVNMFFCPFKSVDSRVLGFWLDVLGQSYFIDVVNFLLYHIRTTQFLVTFSFYNIKIN